MINSILPLQISVSRVNCTNQLEPVSYPFPSLLSFPKYFTILVILKGCETRPEEIIPDFRVGYLTNQLLNLNIGTYLYHDAY
tara:strand:- start:92 stop:337 length:246 start_codon:yes stop_codon:yes gene_type:complete